MASPRVGLIVLFCALFTYGLFRQFTIHRTPDTQRVVIFEFIRQRSVGPVLVTDGPREALNGVGSNGSESAGRRRRVGPPMLQCTTSFHACWEPVEQQAAAFFS